jgi:succinyl-diaminopimelate desuccinylase
MKGGLAAMIVAFKSAFPISSGKTIGLLTNSDEETGGYNGASYVVEEKGIRAKFVIVGDAPRTSTFAIINKEKGGLWLRVSAIGKSAHAARPWLGENAVEKLMKALAKIKRYVGAHRAEKWSSTCNLSAIQTENRTPNIVPSQAIGIVDIRFTEKLASTPDELLRALRKLVPEVELDPISKVPLFLTSSKESQAVVLRQIFQDVTKTAVAFSYGHGASDARYFSARNMPTVIVGPIGGGWHAEEEWVSAKSVRLLSDVLSSYLRKALDIK